MKLYQKRILWISFVILFFILAPLILTYGLGYKYNFAKHKFEETGILFVKTYPRQSEIWLDNKLLDNSTPITKSYLSPGHYNLRIVKDGYLAWNKTITINPRTTTFVEDVVLFKRQLPKPLKALTIIEFLPTLEATKYIILSIDDNSQTLYLFEADFESFKLLTTFALTDEINLVSISPNTRKLIYSKNDYYWQIDVDTPSNHRRLIGLNNIYWQDFKWHGQSDNLVYARVYDSLYEIDIRQNPVKILAQINDVKFYFPHKNKLYYCKKDLNSDKLRLYSADRNFKNIEDLLLLPLSNSLDLIPDDERLTLLDGDNNFLYLIQPESDELITHIFPNVAKALWYPKTKDKILLWNNNEIQVYFTAKDLTMLITRVTRPITNVNWHPNGAYIFYQQDNDVTIIEFDERDKKNSYQIVTLEPGSPLIINSKGDKIFYYSFLDSKFYGQEIQ